LSEQGEVVLVAALVGMPLGQLYSNKKAVESVLVIKVATMVSSTMQATVRITKVAMLTVIFTETADVTQTVRLPPLWHRWIYMFLLIALLICVTATRHGICHLTVCCY